MKYCLSATMIAQINARKATHTVPVVHLVESRARHNERQRLQLLLARLRVHLALHRQSQNPRLFIERLDVGGVIAFRRKLDDFEVEVGFVGGSAASAGHHLQAP